jgi:diguanylate cyclase (GGDEF)-like protein
LAEVQPEQMLSLRRNADSDLLLRSGAGVAVYPVLLCLVRITTPYSAQHPALFWTSCAAVAISVAIRAAMYWARDWLATQPRARLWIPLLAALFLTSGAASLLYASALWHYGLESWTFILLLIQVVGIATGSTVSFTPNFPLLCGNAAFLLAPAAVCGLMRNGSEGVAFAFSSLVLIGFLLIQGHRMNAMYWKLLIDRTLEQTRVEELQEAKARAEQAHRDLLYHATYDALTAVLNRRAVMSQLEEELARASDNRAWLSVAMLDIDHFKRINDTYGHLVGDEVLKGVVARLKESVRAGDIIGRYGGEEFIVILPGCRADQIQTMAERMRLAIADRPLVAGNLEIPVTVSLGAVFTAAAAAPIRSLLSKADLALYQAKNSGRNRVVTCASEGLAEAAFHS